MTKDLTPTNHHFHIQWSALHISKVMINIATKAYLSWGREREETRLTFEIVCLVSLVITAMMMTAWDGELLHGKQILMVGVDQRILQLRLDHLEAGGVVRMSDDLHCKWPSVTSWAEKARSSGRVGHSRWKCPLRSPRRRSRCSAIPKIAADECARQNKIAAALASEFTRGERCYEIARRRPLFGKCAKIFITSASLAARTPRCAGMRN